jgi:hypothetical protein
LMKLPDPGRTGHSAGAAFEARPGEDSRDGEAVVEGQHPRLRHRGHVLADWPSGPPPDDPARVATTGVPIGFREQAA